MVKIGGPVLLENVKDDVERNELTIECRRYNDHILRGKLDGNAFAGRETPNSYEAEFHVLQYGAMRILSPCYWNSPHSS